MLRPDEHHTGCEPDGQDLTGLALQAILTQAFQYFGQEYTQAPSIASATFRTIGIDNRQRCQYNLAELRDRLSPHAPIVQVVGDSGTPFDKNKVPAAQAILSSHVVDNASIEYGFTASNNDTNWLVNDYQKSHPEVALIANVVEQTVEALEAGMIGFSNVKALVLLYDRLTPTRFGDDVWLSDGVMSKERGDKMVCFEGGLQALYQCCNALLKGIRVVAVTNLRSADLQSKKFSASRFLTAFKAGSEEADEYLRVYEPGSKQRNIAGWCLSSWKASGHDIASLLDLVDANEDHVCAY